MVFIILLKASETLIFELSSLDDVNVDRWSKREIYFYNSILTLKSVLEPSLWRFIRPVFNI